MKISLCTVVSPDYDVPTFNLGLYEIGGFLKHNYKDIKINYIEPDVELSHSPLINNSIGYTIDKLESINPDIIGISAKIGSQDNLFLLLDQIKNNLSLKNKLIIVGNVLATFSSDRILESFPNIFCCVGEGELFFGDVVEYFNGNKRKEDISNLVYSSGNKIIKNKRTSLNLSSVEWLPDFSNVAYLKDKKVDFILRSTSGCDACCSFCSVRYMSGDGESKIKYCGWRNFPIARTVKSFKILESHNILSVTLSDDEFGKNNFDYLENLAIELIKNKSKIKFTVSLRSDSVFDFCMTPSELKKRKEILKLLKKAGLAGIFLGIESGSQSQLDRYNKKITPDHHKNAIKILLSIGLKIKAGWIPFDPLVTKEEMIENINFLRTKINGHYIYEFVSSPITKMRIQRKTNYLIKIRQCGISTKLQSNLSFYDTGFLNKELEEIADYLRTLFQKNLKERYAIIQIGRMEDKVGKNDAMNLIKEMNHLDILIMESLINGEKDINDKLIKMKMIINKVSIYVDSFYNNCNKLVK